MIDGLNGQVIHDDAPAWDYKDFDVFRVIASTISLRQAIQKVFNLDFVYYTISSHNTTIFNLSAGEVQSLIIFQHRIVDFTELNRIANLLYKNL